MPRKRTRALAFAAVGIAILSGTTSAFSPILPRSTLTQGRSILPMPLSMAAPNKHVNHPPLRLQLSNRESQDEKSSVATLPEKAEPPQTTTKNPTPVLVTMLRNLWHQTENDSSNQSATLNLPSIPRNLLVALAAVCLAFSPISDANAAMSGGRMGGSFSHAPVMRSVPSRGYSRGYSGGYSRGYGPSVTVAPSFGYYGGGYNPFYNPFYSPRFFGGPGVLSVYRGPSLWDLFVWGGLFYGVSQLLKSPSAIEDSSTSWGDSDVSSPLGPGTSVVSLSVALQVPNRDDKSSILSALDKISQTAKTDSRVGIQNLSSQVALEILRRRSSIVSASSSTQHFSNRPKALRAFQTLSVKERSKFEMETVSKFGGVDYSSSASSRLLDSNDPTKATMAVITLVLAIDGDSTKLHKINNLSDVEQALQKIASDSMVADCLQSAEILWTPENRSESLSVQDVIADYPELRSI